HCDVLRKGVDKAAALSTLLSRLGIDWEQTAAFGDGNNDVEMLERAGFAVVTENGTQSAKQAADVLAQDAQADGVAQSMEEYIL
ncbi:MAG: HAD family hydrolase, partial [Enterococcus sp.]